MVVTFFEHLENTPKTATVFSFLGFIKREKSCKGRVKVYRVPEPGPSKGGRRLSFRKKNCGAVTFFQKILGGEEIFFEKKRAKTFFRQILNSSQS